MFSPKVTICTYKNDNDVLMQQKIDMDWYLPADEQINTDAS